MNFSNFHKVYFVNLPSPYFHESLYHQILYCRKICERELGKRKLPLSYKSFNSNPLSRGQTPFTLNFATRSKPIENSPETMKYSVSKSNVYVSMGKNCYVKKQIFHKGMDIVADMMRLNARTNTIKVTITAQMLT